MIIVRKAIFVYMFHTFLAYGAEQRGDQKMNRKLMVRHENNSTHGTSATSWIYKDYRKNVVNNNGTMPNNNDKTTEKGNGYNDQTDK